MVASLKSSLESQTRLLKQVDNHVSSRQLATSIIKPNTEELTKTRGVVIHHGFLHFWNLVINGLGLPTAKFR